MSWRELVLVLSGVALVVLFFAIHLRHDKNKPDLWTHAPLGFGFLKFAFNCFRMALQGDKVMERLLLGFFLLFVLFVLLIL